MNWKSFLRWLRSDFESVTPLSYLPIVLTFMLCIWLGIEVFEGKSLVFSGFVLMGVTVLVHAILYGGAILRRAYSEEEGNG